MEQRKIVIIGSGPAGYTAGTYAARAKLEPLLFAGYKSGGQLMWTTDVENYPGFPSGVPGPQLMMDMRQQAEKFGTKIVDEFVTAVDFSQRPFKLWTLMPEGFDPESAAQLDPEARRAILDQIRTQPPAVQTETVIIATGAVSVMLGVPGEAEFLGKGVSTCAVCDAAFYRDKDTIVVGGGDSAMEETLALTRFAKSVTVVHRRDSFRASKIMQQRVLNHEKVKVLWNSTVTEVIGTEKVTAVKITTTDPSSGQAETKELSIDGVFIAIGHRPVTQLFEQQLKLDERGYVATRVSNTRAGVELAGQALSPEGLVTFPSMTSVAGVFAAGDVVDVRYKQAITAAGQGCQAALDAERWLESAGES